MIFFKFENLSLEIIAIGISIPGELNCLSSEPLSKKKYFVINFFFFKCFIYSSVTDESLYLEYIIDKFPEPPRHVRFNPPKQSF